MHQKELPLKKGNEVIELKVNNKTGSVVSIFDIYVEDLLHYHSTCSFSEEEYHLSVDENLSNYISTRDLPDKKGISIRKYKRDFEPNNTYSIVLEVTSNCKESLNNSSLTELTLALGGKKYLLRRVKRLKFDLINIEDN